jgi:ATP-binding cassette subfamily B protein
MQVRGAELVQVLGVSEQEPCARPAHSALSEAAEPHPLKGLWAQLDGQGRRAAALLPLAALLGALGESIEVVLLRALLDAAPQLGLPTQRLLGLGTWLLLGLAILAIDFGLFSSALRLGRLIEMRLRVALLARLPHLGDSYFSSRPVSDLADRAHQIFRVREVPLLLALLVRTVAQLLGTAGVLVWLNPRGTPLILLLTALACGIPILLHPLLLERDLRARSHQGSLVRFHLDTLLGTTPLRAHGAEAPLRIAHEDLLSEWAAARRSLARAVLLLFGGQGFLCTVVLSVLFMGYLGQHQDPSGLLLLAYLSLNVPAFGQTLSLYLRQYPALRSGLLRLLEPLQSPVEEAPAPSAEPNSAESMAPSERVQGVEVALSGVEVRASGQTVLREVELHVRPGSQVAIVGVSGAGKSTLLGLLLGLYRAASGSVRIDGIPLEGTALERLRRDTAWVDPAVQLQNRSLLENLRYGSGPDPLPLPDVLAAARLEPVVARFPDGLQTRLGEGGALVSGGEGQRVRLGRVLSRRSPRLVLLDEPFRGLGRTDRCELLSEMRARARGATLFCVTHDIGETVKFERVLVIEDGRIVEDGAPQELLARNEGRYRALFDAEQQAEAEVWGNPEWRRLRLGQGQLREGA